MILNKWSLLVFISVCILVCSSCDLGDNIKKQEAVNVPSQEIKELILTQLDYSRQCWNSGDMEGYMRVYHNSDSLLFMGPNKITRGWKQTLVNYKKGYPDDKTRGYLKYTFAHFNQLSDDCVLVIGRFYLDREIGNAEGNFSLIWKKINGEWKIIQDHS